MYLKSIQLINFKNYREANYDFTDSLNGIVGLNGVGKTNLLDAIHYLSMCKSYFNNLDQLNINFSADFFAIHGVFQSDNIDGVSKVSCIQKRDYKKIFKLNQKEYSRLSDHIGLFPSVMISPYDSDYINGGSDLRRKYFDSIISQYDKIYLDNLIQYNKTLLQRNILLKRFEEEKFYDKDAIAIWTDKLCMLGNEIYKKRKVFINEFFPVFNTYFNKISSEKEDVTITYESMLHDNSLDYLLKDAEKKDLLAQHTTVGTHKDDFSFMMNGFAVKKFCSQGQQKTFLISLKLSHYEYLKHVKNIKPLLLLDDVFDKLDDQRVEKLMSLVAEKEFGQVFITHVQKKSMENLFSKSDINFKIHELIH